MNQLLYKSSDNNSNNFKVSVAFVELAIEQSPYYSWNHL